MSRLPDSFVEAVRDRNDVVEVVGRYVQLKKAGANFSGLCPFHTEKTPSFTVSASKQFYHCFGCGAHGSVISFLMDYAGFSFVDAVEDLARSAGLAMPAPLPMSPAIQARQDRESQVKSVLAQAARFFHLNLRTASDAVAYLKGRGLVKQTVVDFGIGHSGAGALDALKGVPTELLLEAGLVTRHEQSGELREKFRNRVMFPIRNEAGDVIGFGGRAMAGVEPKYLNTAETGVFHKGEELYGLSLAKAAIRQSRTAIVVEGYMDVAMLHQYGERRVVAALGTALTVSQASRLLRMAGHIVFCFDGDAPGQKAADRAARTLLGALTDGKRVSFLTLPGKHDPDSFIRAEGIDAWGMALEKLTQPLSQRLIDVLQGGGDLALPEERAAMAQRVRDVLPDIEQAPLFREAMHAEFVRITGVSIPLDATRRTGNSPQELPEIAQAEMRAEKKRAGFYMRFALLCALAPERSAEVDGELIDGFAELIGGWFQWVGSAGDRRAAAQEIQDTDLRRVIGEALQSHAERTRILSDEGLRRDADALIESIHDELALRDRALEAATLFREQA